MLEVREAERRDLSQIKRLIDEYIAVDFYTMEELENMCSGEDDLLYVVTDGDRVAAYFYAFLSPLDEALRILHIQRKPAALQGCADSERVGVFKTTSTDPAYRRRGLFSAFMTDLQPVLRERGAKRIITTALRPVGREVPIRHILERTGFVPVMTLYRPWVGNTGYCPYCALEHCICDAVLYIREYDEKEAERHGE